MNGYNNAYVQFKEGLNIRPDTLTELTSQQCDYTHESWRGLEQWLTNQQLPVAKLITSAHLYYEILRVDWRHYENTGTVGNAGI